MSFSMLLNFLPLLHQKGVYYVNWVRKEELERWV